MAKKHTNKDTEFLAALTVEKEKYDQIEEVDISSKMRTSFLDYSMSVIVARALPDIRDGLKPVQRRILYGMNSLHIYANTPFKKSARITGEVMGKYHPHGDSSIYDAMVRMAQPFSYRYVLVDGHGNFGNIDGDGAAAQRYTEARMSKISMEMVRDIDKDTVDFVDNYDGEEKEPVILPARIPNLLINGSTGIAVGMATNIPPHNLGEVCDGIFALIDNPDVTIDELMQYIKGPDFPTGGLILGRQGLRDAYNTGLGSIVIRSKAVINELANGKSEIVVTEIPYQVNKTRLIERIAELVKDKIVDGITDLRDESSIKGMRIVIELRKDVNANVMLNNLYKYTQLQTTFGFNMIALVDGQPKTVNLKDILVEYLKHQLDVITRRTKFDLAKTEAREHILKGLVIALEDIDNVIELIKQAKDGQTALEALINKYTLSELQAREILNTRLQRLTGLEIEKIKAEEAQCLKDIAEYKAILADDSLKMNIIREELSEIKDKYNDKRVSEISTSTAISIDDEDLIPRENVLISLTTNGYIKRMKISEYHAQNRGGKGLTGMKTHEDDQVEHIVPSLTHDYLLFFTNKGRVYKVKAYNVMEGSRTSKGIPIINIIPLLEDEKVTSICPIDNFDAEDKYLLFVTKQGIVKRTHVGLFKNIRQTGIIAINLNESDELLNVLTTNGQEDIILGASNGKAIRFSEKDMRDISRSAIGVRGIKLADGEEVVGVGIIESDDDDILVLSEKGYGKRSKASEYRTQGRGGQGVKTLNVTEKNGKLAAIKIVHDDEDLIATTDKGMVIRCRIKDISTTGRATQGVIVMRLANNHTLSTIAIVPTEEDDVVEEAQVETTEITETNEQVTE